MVTQLLFGEIVEILERSGKKWYKVRCTWDDYVGWVSQKQLLPLTGEEVRQYKESYARSLEISQPAVHDEHFLPLTMGAVLPMYDGLSFQFPPHPYQFSGQCVYPGEVSCSAELLIKIARRYLYAPYLWGGRSPFGIDCSGFVQVTFQMVGIQLPRDAHQQVEKGEPVDFVESMSAGDLAFFENSSGKIDHVGIVLEEQQILHASGQVRIDRLDHYGIFSEKEEAYTHKLRVIRRILHESTSPDREDVQLLDDHKDIPRLHSSTEENEAKG